MKKTPMQVTQCSYKLKVGLRAYSRVVAWVMVSVLVFSPLSALASTSIDSEIRDDTQWYAFAAYSEVYEVAPPPHLASLAAQVIEEENWPSDTPVYYHLVNYLIAFEQVDASISSDEFKAMFFDLFDEIVPAIAPNAEPNADTITYTYDDLPRLSTAVATNAANGQNFNHTYTYDAIGNIITMTGLTGNYQYQGIGKTNPHAATVVNGQTYTYDDNGNLTSDGTWTHGWEYDNRLKQSVSGGTTITYGYDHSGQRAKLVNGSSTTRYANKLYNSDGTKHVKHIYAGNQLIATLENVTLQYIHTDHLTGSNVATNNSGTLVQLLYYYPYGSMRIDQTTTFDEQRKFTGHEFDRSTSLTYANARYYKQGIGRFLSQDSVFLAVGNEQVIKQKTGLTFAQYLQDPQLVNSYSYTRNNPLKHIDKSGEFLFLAPLAAYAFAYAPVAIPAAITAGAAIAASAQAYFFGEGIGNLMEGNYQGFQQSVDKQMTVTGISAAVTAGLLEGMSMVWVKQGGAYGDLRGIEGKEKHHVPANSVSPYSRNQGPTLLMDKADHQETSSWGRFQEAAGYRSQQKQLIEQGRFIDAQKMDIKDIQSKFGDKYNQGLREVVDYTKSLLKK